MKILKKQKDNLKRGINKRLAYVKSLIKELELELRLTTIKESRRVIKEELKNFKNEIKFFNDYLINRL